MFEVIVGIIFIFGIHELLRYCEHRRQKRVAREFKEEWAYQKTQMINKLKRIENAREKRIATSK